MHAQNFENRIDGVCVESRLDLCERIGETFCEEQRLQLRGEATVQMLDERVSLKFLDEKMESTSPLAKVENLFRDHEFSAA